MEPLSRDELGMALEPISGHLAEIERIIESSSAGNTSFLTESATYLTRAGGKRLRPALMVLASQFGPKGPTQDVFDTAAAIELTHLATLYHDDVIDEADARRGVASANQRWGNKVAILAGDYLFAKASGLAAAVGGEVALVLADAIAEVVAGQVAELRATYDPQRTEADYFTTIRGKTASLVEACTRLGAGLGGASDEVVASAVRFGAAFGHAFQVADDLLDLAATQQELGKPPGTDLRDGVYTLPVILAREISDDVVGRLGSPDVDVDEMRALVVSSGAFDRAREIAHDYAEQALSALEEVPDGVARQSLQTLTRLVVDRVPPPAVTA